ncbi:PD-(D/E)XK nuclease domain-containing protein [Limibacter armeniacum]|uniref:PD-(D/E)XK nuclease domain-containing protein n=1 Tax=Limibacter armeniacum TaxID=466084 RepID=UPI002FE65D4F
MDFSFGEIYKHRYFPKQILTGIEFYYTLLDYCDPFKINEEQCPISRNDIQSSILNLKRIPEDHQVHNLSHSHPFLSEPLESIEFYQKKMEEKADLGMLDMMILTWLINLVHTSSHIVYEKFRLDYERITDELSPVETLKKLYEYKAACQKNKQNYTKKVIEDCLNLISIEIEKNKSLTEVDNSNISAEINNIVQSYLNKLNELLDKNDLLDSLKNERYEEFIFKIKRVLYIPSYYDISSTDKEKVFHVYLLGVLQGRLEEYLVKSNKESGTGRYDICLNPMDKRNPGVIFEIKKVPENSNTMLIEKELDAAMSQIDEREYVFELKEDGIHQILFISLVFNGIEPVVKWQISK